MLKLKYTIMIIALLEIVIWLILLTLAITALSLAPWVPTRKKDLPRILNLAGLQAGDIFYDLGCGDGRVAFYISENSPAKAIGIELAIPFFVFCRLKSYFLKTPRLEFKLKSIYNENLNNAKVVYLFAANSQKLNEKLVHKLLTELPDGAKIISYAFPILSLKASQIDKPKNDDVAIYLYDVRK